mmetsp:Transcript_4118/g.9301  ORF Transcript_4118/g.9301 Transcript_4118/m.9301 type:complete len:342 (+) Transcript_4118:799-1824(+)
MAFRTLSPRRTNANSPPGARNIEARKPVNTLRPNRAPPTIMTKLFSPSRIASPPSTHKPSFTRMPGCTSMPTVIKNSPSKSPRNGAMSLSTCMTYSVSAISRPARKAPSAMLRPAACVIAAVPMATSSVSAAKSSAGVFPPAMRLNIGRSSTRPPAMIAVMHNTARTPAFTRASPMALLPPAAPGACGASSGTSMSSTTTARSWNSRTLNVIRPWRSVVSPRSPRTCIATAVELSASAPPMTMPVDDADAIRLAGRRTGMSAYTSAMDTHTCTMPSPKTYFAILCRRSSDSSSPMLNRRKTTPNSASSFTASTWLMIPTPFGPMIAPPIRKPRIGDPPGTL